MNANKFLILWVVLVARLCFAEDTFDELKVGKETFKEVRVIQASPIDLLIGHEGGFKRINLQDLPDHLKQKYPYDARLAEEYKRQKAEEGRLRQIQNAAQVRASLLTKEHEIKNKLAPLEKELKRLKADLKVQNANAKGRSAKSAERHAADGLRTNFIQVRDRVYGLRDELEKTETQRKKYE